ncbi:hypothetical protein RHDC4_00497 [Rhodocyclaceae bacterium]|nr:hypothetical protein RHDC4_00497 [Rhodocyclaceae bacterium]
MKVFLAHAFRKEDALLVAEVEKLLRKRHLEIVTGEDLGGGQLTPEVQRRIDASDALIALLTRRVRQEAGGWATHPWVQDELGRARTLGKPAIALVENGIDIGGMYQPHEQIPLDREQSDKALLKLAETLLVWQPSRVRRWPVLLALGFLTIGVALAMGWREATDIAAAVADAEPMMREGRYSQALPTLDTACARLLVGQTACAMRDKAALGAMLETDDTVDIERFAGMLETLRAAQPAEDPDLLLFAGALAMLEQDPAQITDKWRQARQMWERAITLRGGVFPEAHFRLGDQLLRSGDYPGAQAQFSAALASAPHAPHIQAARAYARFRLGNVSGAIADLNSSANAGLISSLVDMAPLLWAAGRYTEAADHLEAAIEGLKKPLVGRNRLPWSFELAAGTHATLRTPGEKICFAQLARHATATLQGAVLALPEHGDCGANAATIARAIAAELRRASATGMPAAGAKRADAYARHLLGDTAAHGETP